MKTEPTSGKSKPVDSGTRGRAEEVALLESLRDEQPMSIGAEFLLFLRENKKWWLLPILIVFGAVSLLATLTTTGAAPFIYSLF